MATVNVIIVRAFEFLFFVLFTYLILVYGGILLLLPLDLVVQIIHALNFVFGDHGFLYAFFSVAAIAALVYRIYKMPVLWKAILDTGYALVRLGYKQNRYFEAMIRSFSDNEPKNNTSAANRDRN
jgi:hypothetical protein